MVNHAGGISLITFVIAVAVSMAYYQFVFLPQASARPILPDEIVNPEEETTINIAEGSAVDSNPQFFVPAETRATMGISNKVVWHNQDTVPHTVTTDDEYRDAYSGLFDSRERPEEEGGPFVMPGETFEFTFTKIGDFAYHCEPHPWMTGKIETVENFS